MKAPPGGQNPTLPADPTAGLAMPTLRPARRYDTPPAAPPRPRPGRTSSHSGRVPPRPGGRAARRRARRAASQPTTMAGSNQPGRYDNKDQTSRAGPNTLADGPVKPDTPSITDTLNGYSVIQAEDIDQVLSLAGAHPYLNQGHEYSIEIYSLP
jgi:hypothetical protein